MHFVFQLKIQYLGLMTDKELHTSHTLVWLTTVYTKFSYIRVTLAIVDA